MSRDARTALVFVGILVLSAACSSSSSSGPGAPDAAADGSQDAGDGASCLPLGSQCDQTGGTPCCSGNCQGGIGPHMQDSGPLKPVCM